MFGVNDVLIPAIRLTALPGIFADETVDHVTYLHVLVENHAVLLAEGAPTESLLTAAGSMAMLGAEARAEILTLFPELRTPGFRTPPARLLPEGKKQKTLIERHLKNAKPILNFA